MRDSYVAVLVAAGLENRALAHLGHAHEGVRRLRRLDGVAGHLDAAVRAVLETHGAGQATGQLAVALALRGAGADGAPADQVADELRRQQVQELGAGRQAQLHHLQQQLARQLQPLVDGEAVIAVRIVDVALPAHGGAWLLEVHTHDDQQVVLQRVGLRLELARVFHGLRMIVDGARPHHHNQTVIFPMQHARDGAATAFHQRQGLLCRRQPLLQQSGGQQRAYGLDAGVVNAGLVQRGQGRRLGQRRRRSHYTIVAVWLQSCQPKACAPRRPVSKSQNRS